MDKIAFKPLTVSFSEPEFVTGLANENRGGDEKLNTMGPQNPQSLNRYSYVLNNPVRNTDPSGHWTFAVTFSGIGFLGTGARGSLTFAFDSSSNFAVLSGVGGGGSTGIGGSIGPSLSVTTAPTVYDLEGDSVQVGFIASEGVGVSAEVSRGKDRQENPVWGGSVGLDGVVAFTPPGFPVVVYGTGERDEIKFSTNDLKRVYHDAGMCFEECEVPDP